jgi:hypothetical protein
MAGVRILHQLQGRLSHGFSSRRRRSGCDRWRLQITLRTADVEDAGTDDGVVVRLNADNVTWLDYGRDDFPRNNSFTYDLRTSGVSRIHHLRHIDIAKVGGDGLCLKSFVAAG